MAAGQQHQEVPGACQPGKLVPSTVPLLSHSPWDAKLIALSPGAFSWNNNRKRGVAQTNNKVYSSSELQGLL